MAYFRCSVGGSGNKLKLTVTCDSGFAGATISCTDGTTTLTATCPSSSPYTVIFKIPNGGTWTVSSGTYSTTVVIPDTATLHQIPTGSSVTPVNDIQTWLHCANIWDKNYTTINQVLADTSTLLALISSNNAADYMARSTNWASSVCANQTAMGYIGNNDYCANKLLANSTWLNAICNSAYMESVLNVKVPTMTSNTTPSGKASVMTAYDAEFAAWKAFDGGIPTANLNDHKAICLCTPNSANGIGWIMYEFTTQVLLKFVTFYDYQQEYISGQHEVKVQGSNNGSTWADIKIATFTEELNKKHTIPCPSNTQKYSKFRLYGKALNVGSNSLYHFSLGALQFYGR